MAVGTVGVHMELVARHFRGEPSKSTAHELRFGTFGSLKINLDEGDWYDHELKLGGGVFAFIRREAGLDSDIAAIKWLKETLGIVVGAEIVATYDYTDESGHLLFQVVRFEPKDFRQRRPSGSDWEWSVKGVRQVPFRLPKLIEAEGETIYIVEGEKDVLTAERLGLVATCNAGGAGKWRSEFSRYFKGAEIVVIPDNDEAGRNHASQVAKLLEGSASKVVIMPLPTKDLTDWVRGGGAAPQLAELVKAAKAKPERRMNGDVPGYDPERPAKADKFSKLDKLGLISASELMLKEFPPLKWAIPDLVPEGLTILAGRPKFGKSWLALDFALAAAAGTNALGTIPCKAGPVLYLALEDTDRRLHARIRSVLQGAEVPDQLDLKWEWQRADNGGLTMLRDWLNTRTKANPARLVIIDTLQKVRGERHRSAGIYEDDYKAVGEFKKLADEYTVPIMILTHENKVGNADHVMAVSGTAGLTGAADTIISLNRTSRTDPTATLAITGRDVIGDEIAIQQDMETGKWLKVGKADDFRLSEGKRAIVRALMDHARQMTPKEISEATGQKRDRTRYFLSRLVRDGDVRHCSNGKYSC